MLLARLSLHPPTTITIFCILLYLFPSLFLFCLICMCLCACVCVGSIYCQFHMKLPLYRVNHKYLYVITSNLKSCLLQLFVKSIIEFLSSSPFSLFSCFSRFLFTTLYTIAFSFALHTFYILPLSLSHARSHLHSFTLC